MIVRIWHGYASPAQPDDYPKHFHHNVLPELRAIAGFLGASLLRQDTGGRIEFIVLTRWTSIDAVRAFAGAQLTRAVVEPAAIAALVDYDRVVQHYELVEEG